MQAGNSGGENRGDGKQPSGKEKLQLSVSDSASDDFKKTWLALKELHDKELHRIQTKLTSLKKQRLADGRWTGSTAKIKELTEQQKVLSGTIQELREQLNAKTCDRCSMNEAYKNKLQQEFYDVQQKNLNFIAQLTAERNKLREENKRLCASLKLNQEQFHPTFSDSDDFIPCTQGTMSVFSVRDPVQEPQVHLPIRGLKHSRTEQMKSGGKKEQQQSSKFSVPFYSQEIFEVPETSFEKTPSNSSKSSLIIDATQKSPASFLLMPKLASQRGCEFQGIAHLPEDKRGQPKMKQLAVQKMSTPQRETQLDLPWSLSSISTGENPPAQIVSETSPENMPDSKRSLFPPVTQGKEKFPLNIFHLDYTLRSSGERSKASIAGDNTGCLMRGGNNQTPCPEQSTSGKNTNEYTGAEYGASKPPDDTQRVISRSTIKRKARVQLQRRRM